MTSTKSYDSTTKGSGAQTGRTAKAQDAAARAKQAIEVNPLGVLAGGLAAGLVAGALVPRSERERQALETVGRRLAEGALAATAAAKQTSKEQLSAALFSPDGAREGVGKVMESVVSAAKDASAKVA